MCWRRACRGADAAAERRWRSCAAARCCTTHRTGGPCSWRARWPRCAPRWPSSGGPPRCGSLLPCALVFVQRMGSLGPRRATGGAHTWLLCCTHPSDMCVIQTAHLLPCGPSPDRRQVVDAWLLLTPNPATQHSPAPTSHSYAHAARKLAALRAVLVGIGCPAVCSSHSTHQSRSLMIVPCQQFLEVARGRPRSGPDVPTGHCRAGSPALQGLAEWRLMLHRPGEYPHGALCPAHALWGPATAGPDPRAAAWGDLPGCPPGAAAAEGVGEVRGAAQGMAQPLDGGADARVYHAGKLGRTTVRDDVAVDGSGNPGVHHTAGGADGGTGERQLWLWLHPAGYAAAVTALQHVCSEHGVGITPPYAPASGRQYPLCCAHLQVFMQISFKQTYGAASRCLVWGKPIASLTCAFEST